MQNIDDIEKICHGKENLEIIKEIHLEIISSGKNVNHRIFPLYIRYMREDVVVAMLYFKGKFIKSPNEVLLGLNLDKKPSINTIVDAKFIKDTNLKYCLFIKHSKESKDIIKKIVKLI